MQVVFDLGGVLASETSQIATAASTLGMPADLVAAHYWSDRRAWDAGASDLEYWQPIAAAGGVALDAAGADRLARDDVQLWVDGLRPEALEVLADLSRAGVVMHLLSNAPSALLPAVEAAGWRGLFSRLFVSGVMGCAKPDDEIYDRVQRDLGVQPSGLAFIDDRPENLRAPSARGWHTHLWRDDADTRRWLESLQLLG